MDNRSLLKRIEKRLAETGLSAAAASIQASGSKDLIRNLRRRIEDGRPTGMNGRNLASLAAVLGTSVQWLATGDEALRQPQGIPLIGLVGAGSTVEPVGETSAIDLGEEVGPLTAESAIALQIRGDSQYPRFLDGEIVLAERDATLPDDLVGNYAVVDTDDGRRMLKILRRGSLPGLFDLESHNAPPEEDVMVVAARRYLACIAAPPQRGLGLKRRRT